MRINSSKKLYIAFVLVCISIFSAVSGMIYARCEKNYCPPPLTETQLGDISGASKLMIVAHPDDETIWGGAHLLEGGYLVVCLTNGNNSRRADEFIAAVERSGNIPLILNYPDKTNFTRNDWSNVYDAIEADISLIMSAKHWDIAATHNPAGEYGHIHHKMTSTLTVQAFETTHGADKLYFFGDYYKASEIENAPPSGIPEDIMRQKLELCEIYVSQKRTMDKLSHMFPHEDWKEYRQ